MPDLETFAVAPDFELDFPETDRRQLTSTFFDTPSFALLRSGLTLHRDDDGCWLTLPTEERQPYGDQVLAPWLADGALGPALELQIDRTVYQPQGLTLFDDEIRASSATAQLAAPRWRELVLAGGGARDRREVADQLRAGGAYAAVAGSRVRHALTGPALSTEASTAGAVLADYVRAQCEAITVGHFAIADRPFSDDPAGKPHEAVHQTRVATRRLRAALRTFAALFEPARATALGAELAWYAAELGEIRDREVLRARLAQAVGDLDPALVVGPVAERIDDTLRTELHEHAALLRQTMADARYAELVAELGRWREAPPFTDAADQPERSLADYVDAAERALARRMQRANGSDERLHDARKAGKRARYAAEAAAPALGKRGHALTKTATSLQTLLGEHQDAMVAAQLLRRIADQLADEGGNAFSFGVLLAEQLRLAEQSAQLARAEV